MVPFLLITDLDNTLVGDSATLQQLNHWLNVCRRENGVKVVYSTGRSLFSYQELQKKQSLLQPDALITSVGTEIYYQDAKEPNLTWSNKLNSQWDRDLVVSIAAHFADLVPQPNTEQGALKVSYYLTEEAAVEVVPHLETLLQERQVQAKIIYSGGQDLDILPVHADKGQAMTFVQEQLGFTATQTVACGDSGNDIALFSMGEERGIIVGNAQPELLRWHQANPSPNHYLAKAACAGGILEGLAHFGFLQN
ncbi:MAG: sucrose-phosphate phosphatase [Leptolyngbyaceae cyanobacterium bins.59]|nr:sucrose-phosphate phosphatase [Leptolyngbyaceae cyanobacterium bins.59]